MSELHAAVQNDLALARTLLGDGDGERCDYGGVNIEDVGGSTPMHWAAASNSVGGVRLLAASGGELEWINQDGHSPLSIAAQEGHTESLRALMGTVDIVYTLIYHTLGGECRIGAASRQKKPAGRASGSGA